MPGLHGHMRFKHERELSEDELDGLVRATKADVKRNRVDRLRDLKAEVATLEAEAEDDGVGFLEIAAIGAAILAAVKIFLPRR